MVLAPLPRAGTYCTISVAMVPWVEKTVDVVEGGIAVPQNCEVEQVAYGGVH